MSDKAVVGMDVLLHAIACCNAWEPGVRLIGNVRAVDLGDLLRELQRRRAEDQPSAVPFVGEFPVMSNDELTLRRLLALNYSGRHLYGDDGELQDGRLPYPIDFRRMSVAEIEARMSWRGVLAFLERRAADKS